MAGSNNQQINLVAQYPSAAHPNGRVHLAYLTLLYPSFRTCLKHYQSLDSDRLL